MFAIPASVCYDGDRDSSEVTTVGRVLNEILPGRFNVPGEPEGEKAPIPDSSETSELFGTLKVQTPAGRTIEVQNIFGADIPSKRFAAELVRHIVQLCRINEELSSFRLFFFERDSWNRYETYGVRYRFFVVHGDKIVCEDLELSSLCDDFFDPGILKSMFELEDWEKDDSENEADAANRKKGEDVEEEELTFEQQRSLAWWYRRFYTETRTGQVQVFWGKALFHYEAPERRQAEHDARLRRVERVVLGIAAYLLVHFVFKWF